MHTARTATDRKRTRADSDSDSNPDSDSDSNTNTDCLSDSTAPTINNSDSENTATQKDPDNSPPRKIRRHSYPLYSCQECGDFLGFGNPRQLCAKYYCCNLP